MILSMETRARRHVLEGGRNLGCGLGRARGLGEQGAPAAQSWASLQAELEDTRVSRKASSGTLEEIS